MIWILFEMSALYFFYLFNRVCANNPNPGIFSLQSERDGVILMGETL